jgi:hypothetical protein
LEGVELHIFLARGSSSKMPSMFITNQHETMTLMFIILMTIPKELDIFGNVKKRAMMLKVVD